MTRARDDGQIQCHYGNACRVLSHRSTYTPKHAQITHVDLRRHSMAESAYKTRSTTRRRRLIKRNAYLWRHNAHIRDEGKKGDSALSTCLAVPSGVTNLNGVFYDPIAGARLLVFTLQQQQVKRRSFLGIEPFKDELLFYSYVTSATIEVFSNKKSMVNVLTATPDLHDVLREPQENFHYSKYSKRSDH
uniref:Uncharacterized protein n=1 Tax=Vespula pensylvanica TaxID=30213 RepID=A0A834P5G6_VESPE|nr:hypothetical protein H0235_005752 [Vespula pensylvanica]